MMVSQFRRRFWQPPRAHGEILENRTVSFLELFYDLVYVVVIAQAAHHLAAHVSWRGIGEFVVIFGMIWIAWLNGTLFYDFHGREDVRTRTFVFVQMILLGLLAVFTGDAAGEDGARFAFVYAAFLLVLAWLWYTVRREDSEEYHSATGLYFIGVVASIVVVLASAAFDDDIRIIVWAAYVSVWVIGSMLLALTAGSRSIRAITATESLVERFGLFTIIVLGEVVVGVVDGLADVESADRALRVTVTGVLGLMIGFAIWWTYFDFVGRRLPQESARGTGQWIFSQLPVSMAIAATGAAMVSLLEHAADEKTPGKTAWLLSGSVAFGLVALVSTMMALKDFVRFPSLYRPLAVTMLVAAGLALVAGWWQPAPWLLALALYVILSAVWFLALVWWLRLDNPDDALPGASEAQI